MMSSDARVHRALSSRARTRLLEVLREEPGLDAARLADRLDLHVNTVRAHLAVLEEADLVTAEAEEQRGRPGRPRILYRASDPPAAAGVADDRGYRFLAGVLASYLGAIAPDGAAAGEQAGAAWGRFVVDRPAPFSEVGPDEAVAELRDLLREFGFQPTLDTTDPHAPRLVLHRCPFLEVAREHQDVVCSVHLGLMRGALEALGVDVEVDDLIPWAEPDACVSHLRVPAHR